MVTKHNHIVDALATIEKNLANARRYDKFMVAVWYVDEKDRLNTSKHTWQFPDDKFLESIRELISQQLIGDEEVPDPLPEANIQLSDSQIEALSNSQVIKATVPDNFEACTYVGGMPEDDKDDSIKVEAIQDSTQDQKASC